MKEVELTQGKKALIDDADLELVSGYKWMAQRTKHKWYAITWRMEDGERKRLYMHRLLMNPEEGLHVDHKDNDGLNNTRSNLRVVTCSQNLAAKQKAIDGKTSRFRGVCSRRGAVRGPWFATIRKMYLGQFDSEEEAARARDKRARELWGEFADLNFPETTGDN